MPLFRALAKNMAPMTNADESPTNRLTLFPIYLSLFVVSTLCLGGSWANFSLLLRYNVILQIESKESNLQGKCYSLCFVTQPKPKTEAVTAL